MYEYKCLPLELKFNSTDRLKHSAYLAENIENMLNKEAESGWEFQKIETFQEGSDTFTKFFASGNQRQRIQFYIVIFRRTKI